MTRGVIADTGPLYAAVDADDQFHGRAQRGLTRLARERREVVLAYTTLLEAYTLVVFRLGNHAAASFVTEISAGTSFINPTPDDYRYAIQNATRFRDRKITLFDATVAVLAERLHLQVWTFDHHFDVMRAPVWR
jgi:predicted nucleic acid-binding protein